MRISLKMIFGLLLSVFLLLTGVFVYLKINAGNILRAELARRVDRKIEFENVFVSFPASIRLENLYIQDLGTAQEVLVSVSVAHLFLGQIYLSSVKIIDPNFYIIQDVGSQVDLTLGQYVVFSQEKADISKKDMLKEKVPEVLFINQLTIEGGHFHFSEKKGGEEESLFFSLKQLRLKIKNLNIPVVKSLKTYFDGTALISGFGNRFYDDQIKFLGWADFFQKNMQAKLTVEALQGQAGLSADLFSENNDLLVKGVVGLAFSQNVTPRKPESFEGFLLDALKATKTQVSLDFQFKTKMDHFQIGEVSLSGSLGKE